MYDNLINRLHRYSENCVAYKLDADFASAVQESAEAIEERCQQVDKFAEEAARLYGKRPVALLSKIRDTRAQSSLSAAQRHDNVSGAYAYTGTGSLDGKRVLLVDDVVTTGATLGACAQLLYQAGAGEVICLTLARSSLEG
jgi:predicted amidophosphoribosyltransferase